MQVIDVLIGMANDMLPSNFEFHIDGSRAVYYIRGNMLYYRDSIDSRDCRDVHWGIYKSWLNKPIQIVGEK